MTQPSAKVKLQSSDDREFEVDRDIAITSITIKNMLDDIPDADTAIPLPNVKGKILEKVIEYCQHLKENPPPPVSEEKRFTEEISPWDKTFTEVDHPTLFDLILAANYLDIKPLLDLTCKTVALMLKGKTPDEIRKHFGITREFTPEDEAQVLRENPWLEEH